MSSIDVVNEALELIADQAQITGFPPTDTSPAAVAAQVIYAPVVQMMLRRLDPEFARTHASLAAQANTTLLAVAAWSFEYAYPATCLRLRQIAPVQGSYDVNDPQPVRGEVAWDPLTAGGPAKVILTNQASAIAVFTTSAADETMWDANFREAVVRRLGSVLAMAVAGRPDFARELLEESAAEAQRAELNEL